MRRKVATSLLLVCIFAALAASTGCEKSKPVVAQQPSKELPANFPDDFPFDSKWKIVESNWSMNDRGRTLLRVRWEAPGQVDQVLGYFNEELPKRGWAHTLTQDLQTKVLSIWRQTDQQSDTDRLIVSPADPHGGGDGVFVAVQLTL